MVYVLLSIAFSILNCIFTIDICIFSTYVPYSECNTFIPCDVVCYDCLVFTVLWSAVTHCLLNRFIDKLDYVELVFKII